jgi:O-Antigen ligase
MIRVRWGFDSVFFLLIGFLLPVVPEAAVVLLCVCGGLTYFFAASRQLRTLEVAALLFAFSQAWLAQRAGQPMFLVLVTFVVICLLALTARVVLPQKHFFCGVLIGLFVVLCLSGWDAFGFKPTPPDRWLIQPELVQAELGGISSFTPKDVGNTWFLANFGLQGSGEIEYVLEMKANQPIELSISLIVSSVDPKTSSRVDKICKVEKKWGKCSIRISLQKRVALLAAIGGYGTWNSQGPTVYLRESKLKNLSPVSIVERLQTFSRVSANYFNENAFGAVFSILGFFLFILAPGFWLKLPVVLFSLTGIALSGSRNAFIAFSWSLIALFWSQKTRWVLLPALIMIVFLGFGFLGKKDVIQDSQFSNPANRILLVNDRKGFSERSDIYRKSAAMLIQQPMIGEKRFLDVLNQRLGFSTHEITHSHNTFFQFAASGGFLALAPFYLLLFCLIFRGFAQKNGYLLLFLGAYLTINLFDHLFFFAPLHAVFWLAAGIFGNSYRGPSQVKSGRSMAV